MTSSENRDYIPFDFIDKKFVANNSCSLIPKATLYHFGVLTSQMHMTWMRYVCGRLESRYRYSNEIVYNNYPWPNGIPKKKKDTVENAAQKVLDIRHEYIRNGSSLVDLYDTTAMPSELLKAHHALDKAVDKCYRDAAFPSEQKRIEYLFELYDSYTSGMFPDE